MKLVKNRKCVLIAMLILLCVAIPFAMTAQNARAEVATQYSSVNLLPIGDMESESPFYFITSGRTHALSTEKARSGVQSYKIEGSGTTSAATRVAPSVAESGVWHRLSIWSMMSANIANQNLRLSFSIQYNDGAATPTCPAVILAEFPFTSGFTQRNTLFMYEFDEVEETIKLYDSTGAQVETIEGAKSIVYVNFQFVSILSGNRITYYDDITLNAAAQPKPALDMTDSIALNGDFENHEIQYGTGFGNDRWSILGGNTWRYDQSDFNDGASALWMNFSASDYNVYRFSSALEDVKYTVNLSAFSTKGGAVDFEIAAIDPVSYVKITATVRSITLSSAWQDISFNFVVNALPGGGFGMTVDGDTDHALENADMDGFLLQMNVRKNADVSATDVYLDSFTVKEYFDAKIKVLDAAGEAVDSLGEEDFLLLKDDVAVEDFVCIYDMDSESYIFSDLLGAYTIELSDGSVKSTLDKLNHSATIYMPYTASITLEDEGGAAITGATVTTLVGGVPKTFTEGAGGVYALVNAYGELIVSVNKTGYVFTDTTLDLENRSKTVTGATLYAVEITVEYAGSAVGAGVDVSITIGGTAGTYTTDANGKLQIGSLMGDTEIRVTAIAGYNSVSGGEIDADKDNTAFNVTAIDKLYVATITLADEDGAAITGATITTEIQGATKTFVETSAGVYTLENAYGAITITISSGYDGWYKDDTLTTAWNFATDTVTGNITLYAKRNVITFSVSITYGTGEVNVKLVVKQEGETVSEADITADMIPAGYKFEGFYLDSAYTQRFDSASPITPDMQLYVKWAAIGVEDDGGCKSASVGAFGLFGLLPLGIVALVLKKRKNGLV